MGKVTEQTVTIKKSPRSTFGLSRSKCGSGRIGDLNVVEHIMMEPSDMVRCSVDTEILFISPLSVPAFAKMKVLTYYFFDSYQNVCDSFNDIITNYMHETKSALENGQVVTKSGYMLPNERIYRLSEYVCAGLHWNPPINPTASTVPIPPFGSLNFYDTGLPNSLFNYKMQYNFCFSTYEQKVDIAKLLNQFDIPYGLLIPLSKNFQDYLTDNLPNKDQNSIIFNWSSLTDYDTEIANLPISRFWAKLKNFAGDGFNAFYNYSSDTETRINTLPMRCYQHIFNDWFLDTMKNTEIDIFKTVITYNDDLLSGGFKRESEVDLTNAFATDDRSIYYQYFKVFMPTNEQNYYMNSLFAIRRPWYSKDYFNTSTNDPTLGVSPYAVGSSVLDLRKNSALQRLAEKKALCGNKFVDFIVQHFNYYPPELDISRSIHLGTSVNYVNVNQVLQTSQTTDSSAQGERAATAQSYGRNRGVFFKAPTYGEFMVLQCVKPEIDYYDGIPREMMIVDVADVPLPELSQIGFDKISNTELFSTIGLASETTFGYVPRYSWRKTRLNRIYGELCNSLDYWHQSPSLRFGVKNDYKFGQIGFDIADYWNTEKRETTILNPAYNRIFAITDVNEDTYVYRHNIQMTLNTCLPTNDSPQL